jgi:hypothetical protein
LIYFPFFGPLEKLIRIKLLGLGLSDCHRSRPGSAAQVFYRRFLLHNNFHSIPISLDNISAKLNYQDQNETNLPKTVEQSILSPLKEFGLISSYEKEDGLAGLKYVVHRRSLPLISEAPDVAEPRVCKTTICCKQFHLFRNRYEEPNHMILYDIIRYHNPQSYPEGESWAGPFF